MNYRSSTGCGRFLNGLYRDPRNARIAGVCAGLGQYIGIEPFLVRLGWVASFFVIGPLAILIYALAAIFLPVRDSRSRAEQKFWEAAEGVVGQVKEHLDRHADRDLFSRGRERWGRWDKRNGRADEPAAAPDPANADRVRDTLRNVEKRIATMEAYVASREFDLSRAIRDLER